MSTNNSAVLLPRTRSALLDFYRNLGVAGMYCIAAVHIIDGLDKLTKTPNLSYTFFGLATASVFVSYMLVTNRHPRFAWWMAFLSAGSAITVYCLTRTIGLFKFDDDIGNWSDLLGVISLSVEGVVVLTSMFALAWIKRMRKRRRRQRPQPQPQPQRAVTPHLREPLARNY